MEKADSPSLKENPSVAAEADGSACADFQPFVDHARFLANWYWLVADGFERKAVQVLAFNGVIIALLPNTFADLKQLPPGAPNIVGRAFVIASLVLLVVAVLCSLGATWQRKVNSLGTMRLRQHWKLRNGSSEYEAVEGQRAIESIGIALLDGDEDNALLVLQNDTSRRGKWMTAAFIATAAGLVVLAVPIAILAQHAVR